MIVVLFEILFEQVSLFTVQEIDMKNWSRYSKYERERDFFNRMLMRNTRTIQSRLIQVIEKLNL